MPLLPQRANSEENNQTLDDRTPLPAGTYLAHVVKTEFKETKKKNGHYLAVQFKVLDGDYKGRSVFANLNLDNPNPVAVEIANKELNSICAACGLTDVEDSDELLQIPLGLKVLVEAATPQYPESNSIAGYVSEDEAIEELGGEPGQYAPAEVKKAEVADVEVAKDEPKKKPWE